jgi:hypothetical protein
MTMSRRLLRCRLLLVAAALTTVPACTTTESHTDMPGYRFEFPSDLPKTFIAYGKSGESYEGDARERYKTEHEAGWRECFWGYRNKKIELSDPCPDLPDWDPDHPQARGRRDGYEECRHMLLANGNR